MLRNIEDIDLESQKRKLEETKQVIDHLESQVDSYHKQSEAQLEDVYSQFDKSKSSGEVRLTGDFTANLPVILSVILRKKFQNAEDILNQAIDFKNQIGYMINDVEAAIQQGSNAEEKQAIADKRAEVSSNFNIG